MSDRVSELLRESRVPLNRIPSGRQLPRTPPPLTGVKKELHFSTEDDEETSSLSSTDQNRTFDFNTFGTESDDPNSMLKGMKDYQLTLTDLEFIEKMRVEKCIKRLQGDLEEVQRLLMKETMPLELALASREKAQAELQMFPSCEDLTEWVKVVLKMTSPSTALTDLDAKSLLAMVTEKTIRRAEEEKRIELTRLEKRVANKYLPAYIDATEGGVVAFKISPKNMLTRISSKLRRKKEAQAKGQLQKQVAHEQLKIQGSMSRLADLKSQLLQQEDVYKALEMQINAQESPEITAKEVDAPEELQATKRQANCRGKGRTKALESTEKLQDATNQSKSTRSKLRDRRTGVRDDHGRENTSETLKPEQKKTTARTPSQEVETTAQESVGAVRGRRTPPGTSTPPLKHQSRAKAGGATSRRAAGDETQHTVLRRSRRIASRAAVWS